MIAISLFFLLFVVSACQLHHGWMKDMGRMGELTSMLNGTVGTMDYYEYSSVGMHLTLYEHMQGWEKELRLTISGLSEKY
jgi:hypothetical protein